MVTKKDKVDDVEETNYIDPKAPFWYKITTLNFKIWKLKMWRFMIYCDFIDDPPKFMT